MMLLPYKKGPGTTSFRSQLIHLQQRAPTLLHFFRSERIVQVAHAMLPSVV